MRLSFARHHFNRDETWRSDCVRSRTPRGHFIEAANSSMSLRKPSASRPFGAVKSSLFPNTVRLSRDCAAKIFCRGSDTLAKQR